MKNIALFLKLYSLQVLSVCIVANLVVTAPIISAESSLAFRKLNGLQTYVPPGWFLRGYFIACEKNPKYVFGTVQDFSDALGGTTTWLIEDLELVRLKEASADDKKIEYSLYLEAVLSDRTDYWVFVVQPYDSAQEWYDARRSYHGRKAEAYYGKSRSELELALSQGFDIKAELRFWIENGETSLNTLEDVLINKYHIKPLFDLGRGAMINQGSKIK